MNPLLVGLGGGSAARGPGATGFAVCVVAADWGRIWSRKRPRVTDSCVLVEARTETTLDEETGVFMELLIGALIAMLLYVAWATACERDEVGPEEYEWDDL